MSARQQRSHLARAYLDHEPVVLGGTAVLLFLVFWEGLSRGWWADLALSLGGSAEFLRIRPIFISSPTRVVSTFWDMAFTTGDLWHDFWVSGYEYVLGFALAVAVGVPLGLAGGWYRRLNYAVEPFLLGLNATPQIAFLPLFIIWFGIGLWSKVVIIFLLTFLPIAINALSGARAADPRLLKVARSFGASEWNVFRNLVLPSAVPFLLAGLRLGIGRAMIGIVVGELFGASSGIGFMIGVAGGSFETDKVFVGVIVIVMSGLALTEAVRRLEARVEAWRPKFGAAA
jgi:ABC-type nitrate/sulfonate/bicarbonate transport system permease component